MPSTQPHAGTITTQAVLKTLNGEVDNGRRQAVKAARAEFSRAANDLARYPDFLECFHAFMARFPRWPHMFVRRRDWP